jgi:hypothetical protein
MRSCYRVGLIASIVCGSLITFAGRSFAAGAVHGGVHGGHGRVGHIGRDHFGVGFGFGGFGCGFGCEGLYGCTLGGNDERIPFYALYPPVYYSHIVARPYGWTPFAYSPDAIILPLEDGGSKEIINPFVPPSNPPATQPKVKPTSEHTADDAESSVHVVVNPYVLPAVADAN